MGGFKGRKVKVAESDDAPTQVNVPAAKPADETAQRPGWTPERVRAFAQGLITLAELEGLSKEELADMAEVGRDAFSAGQIDKAREIFQGLMILDPRNAFYCIMVGAIAQETEDWGEAERAYDRAIKLNPLSPTALTHRGDLRIRQGRVRDGVLDLERALIADPERKKKITQKAADLLAVWGPRASEDTPTSG